MVSYKYPRHLVPCCAGDKVRRFVLEESTRSDIEVQGYYKYVEPTSFLVLNESIAAIRAQNKVVGELFVTRSGLSQVWTYDSMRR
jgi:hypothetical protein